MPDLPVAGEPAEVTLPHQPEGARSGLAAALAAAESGRRAAVAEVAARWPTFLDAWAQLARLARDDVEAYAYARVGYHRGLDALRGAGWRPGSRVRWSQEENRGFLRALDALRAAAEAIGEDEEAQRCARFLTDLDPGVEPGALD
jgi:hypothetical protein